jgi:hypothetical protein
MGVALAWLVVESGDAAAIAAALGVRLTGQRGPLKKFPLALLRLADGRSLVVSTHADEPVFKSKQMGAMSALGRVFIGHLEEHVMASGFETWSRGRKTWSVAHQGDDDPLHLKTTGKLPPNDAKLKATALERQRAAVEEPEEDHLFELSLELARRHAMLDPNDLPDGEYEQLHIGVWRELWRRTFWWRLLFVFLAGAAVYFAGIRLVVQILVALAEQIGLR